MQQKPLLASCHPTLWCLMVRPIHDTKKTIKTNKRMALTSWEYLLTQTQCVVSLYLQTHELLNLLYICVHVNINLSSKQNWHASDEFHFRKINHRGLLQPLRVFITYLFLWVQILVVYFDFISWRRNQNRISPFPFVSIFTFLLWLPTELWMWHRVDKK